LNILCLGSFEGASLHSLAVTSVCLGLCSIQMSIFISLNVVLLGDVQLLSGVVATVNLGVLFKTEHPYFSFFLLWAFCYCLVSVFFSDYNLIQCVLLG